MVKKLGRNLTVVAPIPRKKSVYAQIPLERKKNGGRVKVKRKMLTNAGREGIGEGRFMLDTMLTTLLVVMRIRRMKMLEKGSGFRAATVPSCSPTLFLHPDPSGIRTFVMKNGLHVRTVDSVRCECRDGEQMSMRGI